MGSQQTVAISLVVLALLSVVYQQAAGSVSAQPQLQANCSLVFQGYGRNSKRPGLKAASLDCSTTGGPIPIGVNVSHLHKFAASFSGVKISNLGCQKHAAERPWPTYALLYFCGDYHITLTSAVVHDVWLPDAIDQSYFTAVVAFGGATNGTIVNGHFHSNSAGSMMVLWQEAAVRVYSTNFTSLTGERVRGASAMDSARLEIVDCHVSNITSNRTAAVLAFDESSVTVTNSSFVWNMGSCVMAAINTGKLHISDSTFHGNLARSVLSQNSSQVTITGCNFTSNKAAYGAAISATERSSVNLAHSYLGHNTVTYNGSVIVNDQAKVTLRSCTLAGNSADLGGGVAAQGQGQAMIINCSFSHNQAQYGAAIYGEGQSSITLAYSRLLYNNATDDVSGQPGKGGAVDVSDQVKATLLSCHLEGNSAGMYGGGVAARGDAKVRIDRCKLQGNKAEFGAALHFDDDSNLVLSHSHLSFNNATYSGGALNVNGQANVTLLSCQVEGNFAASYGGGVAAYGQGQVTVRNCNFTHNQADEGGAVDIDINSKVTLVNSYLGYNNASTYGGAVYVSSTKTLAILLCKLEGNEAVLGGGAIATDKYSQVLINQSSIINNRAVGDYSGGPKLGRPAEGYGGGLMLRGYCNCTLSAVDVHNNSAEDGAGLYVADSAQVYLSGTVANNSATDRGGGVFLADDALVTIRLPCQIVHNKADIRGGGFVGESSGFVAADITSVTHGNSAPLSRDIAVRAIQLSLRSNKTVSGYAYKLGTDQGVLSAQVLVSGWHGLPCQGIHVSPYLDGREPLDAGSTGFTDSHGLAQLLMKMRKDPGRYMIAFKAEGVHAVVNVTVEVRGCIKGEVTPDDGVCEDCMAGHYSLDPRRRVCDLCPPDASCPGGAAIIPNPGYWHSTADSNQIHRCPNPSACRRNVSIPQACSLNAVRRVASCADLQCEAGYQGNVCGMCAQGYGSIRPFHCLRCMSYGAIVTLYVVGALLMLVFVRVLCHFTLVGNAAADVDYAEHWSAAEIIRCIVLYSQRMLIVAGLGIDWPASMAYPLKFLGWFWSTSSGETLSTDCLPRSAYAALPLAVQRIAFYLCTPIAMLLVLLLVEVLWVRVRPSTGSTADASMVNRLISTAMVIMFFFLPALLRVAFGLFACIQLDQSATPPVQVAAVGAYWVHDVSIQCFTGYHRLLALGLGLPLVAVLCLGLPVLIVWVTVSNVGRLSDISFKQNYGFLTKSYKLPSRCWWEAVVLWETIALVAVSVFGVNMGPYYQCLLMVGVLFLLIQLQAVCRPYAIHRTERAMLMGKQSLLFTTIVGLSFLSFGTIHLDPKYGMIMGAFLLVINLMYVSYLLWMLVKLIDWQQWLGWLQNQRKTCHKVVSSWLK